MSRKIERALISVTDKDGVIEFARGLLKMGIEIIASGGSTARAAAEATGLSLRQAQSVLKTLAAEGACVAEKRGPKLHYHLEDTTFSEPTRV